MEIGVSNLGKIDDKYIIHIYYRLFCIIRDEKTIADNSNTHCIMNLECLLKGFNGRTN